jgi:hypothetical protein
VRVAMMAMQPRLQSGGQGQGGFGVDCRRQLSSSMRLSTGLAPQSYVQACGAGHHDRLLNYADGHGRCCWLLSNRREPLCWLHPRLDASVSTGVASCGRCRPCTEELHRNSLSRQMVTQQGRHLHRYALQVAHLDANILHDNVAAIAPHLIRLAGLFWEGGGHSGCRLGAAAWSRWHRVRHGDVMLSLGHGPV